MLRAVVAVALIAVYTAILGVPAVLFGVLRRARLERAIGSIWGRGILWALGVRVAVSGVERCPQGPAVYAANHASALDIPILFGHLPVDFRIVHKGSLYFVPLIGLYLYVAGHIGIDRGNAFRARKSLERAATRIRGGTSVVVFPEGTRSPVAEVAAFKRGSFLLALEAGVPVVPLSLVGVKHVAAGGLRLRPGTVKLLVHPAVPTAGRSAEQAGELAEEVRRIVVAGCQAA